jgi:transposase-like protein
MNRTDSGPVSPGREYAVSTMHPLIEVHREQARAIARRGDADEARVVDPLAQFQELGQWKSDAPKLADRAEDNMTHGFTAFGFPRGHRIRLRTTNRLERVNRESKRRTRVASIFPDRESCLRLVSAPKAENDEDRLEGKAYLNMTAR